MTDTLLPGSPVPTVAPAPEPVPPGPPVPPAAAAATVSGAVSGVSPAAVLGAAAATVGGLLETLWAARGPGELLAALTAAERLRSTLDAVTLAMIGEIDATNAAATIGWASTKDYLTAVTGGRTGEGRRLVALARALGTDRAATATALANARLSRTQAAVVVDAVDRLPGNPALRAAAETLLLDEAGTRDATELTRLGAHLLERLDPDGAERREEKALDRTERAAHAARFLSIAEDGIGGVRLTGRGTIEDAAHLKTVLFAMAAPHPATPPGTCGRTPGSTRSCGITDCAHDGSDPRDHGTRMCDALIEMSHIAADTDRVPTSHGTRPRIGVTITLDDLRPTTGTTTGTGIGTGTLDTGETLSASAVRRLACDAEILPSSWAPDPRSSTSAAPPASSP